jgi:hypothetical protein
MQWTSLRRWSFGSGAPVRNRRGTKAARHCDMLDRGVMWLDGRSQHSYRQSNDNIDIATIVMSVRREKGSTIELIGWRRQSRRILIRNLWRY